MRFARLARPLVVAAGMIASLTVSARAVSDTAILGATPPKQLSEFGFFEDLQKQTPASGVVPFRLATPLFSDGAEKFRFVYVPNGQAVKYDPRKPSIFRWELRWSRLSPFLQTTENRATNCG